MALLTTYKNPQANILYGAASNKYTPQQIRDYIKTPGRTDEDVLGKALAEGVTADEISNAMKGDPGYTPGKMESYLAGRGITKELAVPPITPPVVAAPPPVTPNKITVGSKDTVAGQMHGILQDPNNPLNVQAITYGNEFANKRGLLNSSIAASAAQDALYKNAQPIAAQDASTNYDSNKTNVGNKLTADMFNNDLTSRVGMFNAGTQKDIDINTQNRNLDLAIANLDAGNKMAIAQVQAAANDSGIMGDLGKTLMSQYTNVLQMNLSPELRDQALGVLNRQFEQLSGLLPSFENAAKKISFSGASNTGGTSFNGTPEGGGLLTGGTGTGGSSTGSTVASLVKKVNILGYQTEPGTLGAVGAYERQTGNTVDRSMVVPQQLIEDMRYGNLTPSFGESYISNDGTPKVRHYNAYDYKKLMAETGAKNQGELFGKLFIPIHGPRSMRADNPLFYVWSDDALRLLK